MDNEQTVGTAAGGERQDQIAEIQAELQRLQHQLTELATHDASPVDNLDRPAVNSGAAHAPSSRRQVLRTGAAAIGAGVAGLALTSQPAAAANGDAVLLGVNNASTATTLINATSVNGEAIRGSNGATTGNSDGLYGLSQTTVSGAGVRGFMNNSTNDGGSGVFGSTNSPDAVGVTGKNSSTNGIPAIGVLGESASPSGTGVHGVVSTDQTAAIRGQNQQLTGEGVGIYGQSDSSAGVGGRFYGEGAAIAAQGRVGITDSPNINTAPEAPIHVKQAGSTDPVELCLLLESSVPPQQIFKNGSDEWFFAMTSDKEFKISKKGTNRVEAKFFSNGNLRIAGTLTELSDENAKNNIAPVDPQTILDAVGEMPVSTWQYKADPEVTHLGPTAQDFATAFGLGDTTTGIANVDANGVALAAIKALHTQNQQLQAELAELRQLVSG